MEEIFRVLLLLYSDIIESHDYGSLRGHVHDVIDPQWPLSVLYWRSYIYYRYRDVTAFVEFGEETDSNCDISTTVIDINCSYGENLDLPCKNILSVMTVPSLSVKAKKIDYARNSAVTSISRACHELSMTSLLLDDIPVQLYSLTIIAQRSFSRRFAILYLPIGSI